MSKLQERGQNQCFYCLLIICYLYIKPLITILQFTKAGSFCSSVFISFAGRNHKISSSQLLQFKTIS